MKIHNIEQGTPERFEVRKLKMTASNATQIGNCWKWLDTYVLDLVVDSISTAEKDNYTSKDMERWNELESIARQLYEIKTWNDVKGVWFIEYSPFVWCSPDWLIGMIKNILRWY